MAIVIYNDNGTLKVVKLGTQVVSTDANATESYTITWKAYDGTTLKTENLIYGATSTAPTGTSDTAQYDYSWPQNSVVVTGNETIQETRTLQSYTITWYFYNGDVAKQENLIYGETSYAPTTGTSDTTQHYYSWPQNSVVVTGNETITETRTLQSYTITWKAYNGTILKADYRSYGSTSTAPTGTPEDSDWYYYWPQNSVVVTGPQTIQELRTTITLYTITWYFYDGTIAKQENLTYGETSYAPTFGTSDTTQHYYSWPQNSVVVTGNETITETRNLQSYTITWKSYNGTTLKSQTLSYGATSTAPTGTPEDSDWYYYWPQNSVVVTGNETIQETRTELYTITWYFYNGDIAKQENLTYGETAYLPTTGTSFTAQYYYYWPKSSFSVTGNETITETRATRSYTITWKAFNNTTLKTDYLSYGSTSTAPTGTDDTAQYDYEWPEDSVVVTGPQTIQETRTIKSYTITWKAYGGTILDSETLPYGETAYAPTGTSDTAQYDYEWPKSSTYVTGNETIQETRTTRSYTITWKAYDGAILKSETLSYNAPSHAPTGTAETNEYVYSWPQNTVVVTGNETIQETRTARLYTIIWKAYNGATLKTDYLTYGETSTAPTGTADTDQYEYSWPQSSASGVANQTIQETRTTRSLQKPDIISIDGAYCQPYVEIYNPNGVAVTVRAGTGVNPTTSYGELNAYGTGTFYIDVGANPAGKTTTVYVRLYNASQGYSASSHSSVTIADRCLDNPGM